MDLSNTRSALRSIARRYSVEEISFLQSVSEKMNEDLPNADVRRCIDILVARAEWEFVAAAVLFLLDCLMSRNSELNTLPIDVMRSNGMSFLCHDEPRVRNLTARLVGKLANKLGSQYFEDLAPVITAEVLKIFRRRETTRVAVLGEETEIALDDTTGWHSLESLLVAYKELVEGCGSTLQYLKKASGEDVELYVRLSSKHINR